MDYEGSSPMPEGVHFTLLAMAIRIILQRSLGCANEDQRP